MNKDFAIIGLGSFGQSLCHELTDLGAEVIALDINEERVNSVADYVTFAYCCDCTKRSALEKINLHDVEVVLAIGDNLEAIILTVILLKELGAKKIIARSEDESIKNVLLHLGVDEVVDTRQLAVSSLSYRLLSRGVTQYFELTSNHSVATVRYWGNAPSDSLIEMDFRSKFDLNVLLIRRDGKDIVPTKEDRFEPGDEIVVFGTKRAIKKMDKKIG